MKKIFYTVTTTFLFFCQTPIHAQSWTELGGTDALAANGRINTICTDPAGNIYAAGDFTNSSGHYYSHLIFLTGQLVCTS